MSETPNIDTLPAPVIDINKGTKPLAPAIIGTLPVSQTIFQTSSQSLGTMQAWP